MNENKLEFQISGCIFTNKDEITINELNDEFINFCENKGWEFCGIIIPLENK